MKTLFSSFLLSLAVAATPHISLATDAASPDGQIEELQAVRADLEAKIAERERLIAALEDPNADATQREDLQAKIAALEAEFAQQENQISMEQARAQIALNQLSALLAEYRETSWQDPEADVATAPMLLESQTLVEPEGDAQTSDRALWEKAQKSGARQDFAAYLAAYPDGQSASLARIALEKLDKFGSDNLNDLGSAEAESPDEPQSEAANAQKPKNGPDGLSPQKAYLKAKQLLQTGKHGEARKYLQSAIKRDHIPSMLLMGNIFRNGRGVAQSPVKAANYFMLAAALGENKGYARALRTLDGSGKYKRAADVLVKYYRAQPREVIRLLENKDVSKKSIIALQREMRRRGFYRGQIDGDFGPASRNALRKLAANQF